MKCLVLLSLCVCMGFGFEPQFAVRVAQPLDGDVQLAYRVLPEVTLGLRFPQTDDIAVTAGMSGSMMRGAGMFSFYEFWSAKARVGLDVLVSKSLEARLDAGLLYAYAQETAPEMTEPRQTIIEYHAAGSGFGASLGGSMPVARLGAWKLDVACGFDLLRVLTDRIVRPGGEEEPGEYYALRLQSFGAGVTLRRSGTRRGGD